MCFLLCRLRRSLVRVLRRDVRNQGRTVILRLRCLCVDVSGNYDLHWLELLGPWHNQLRGLLTT